ncbi:nucleoside recognition domain-containing protein [Alteribacillus sp. HJP-4]|uniref:nucleoside recognition domain-containing protein n=1 Tax=Alteribacillus sp. HJP-4 TaxID=2775394 RepID=UPI0035CD1CEA
MSRAARSVVSVSEASQQDIEPRVLMVGLESVGKTSAFALLTNGSPGKETNVKGSTIFVKEERYASQVFVDTPGIRLKDTITFQAVQQEIKRATHVLFVVRGTHFTTELRELLPLVPNREKKMGVLVTFKDKMEESFLQSLQKKTEKNDWPLVFVDARNRASKNQNKVLESLRYSKEGEKDAWDKLLRIEHPIVEPKTYIWRNQFLAPFFSVLLSILLFALPVMIAYFFSGWAEGHVENWVIAPVESLARSLPGWLEAIIASDYGILTLGMYSFVWAFPVVVFIAIANALTDDSGLKDRIVDSLDPAMKRIGLNGQDLVPYLTGFGCNVVAVHQTRGCSVSTRTQCVSLISFGSACSYQIGATISVFSVAGMPWMFLPYLLVLTFVGAIHNRVWYPVIESKWANYFANRQSFLQWPTFSGVKYRVISVLKQFIMQAMPIFLLICVIASLLDYVHVLSLFTSLVAPVLQLFGLPGEAGSGLVFSMIRKDGILLFNEGNGALLTELSTATVFLLVYLASTLSACLVTIWAIAKELKKKAAVHIFVKQMVTSIISAALLLLIIRFFGW